MWANAGDSLIVGVGGILAWASAKSARGGLTSGSATMGEGFAQHHQGRAEDQPEYKSATQWCADRFQRQGPVAAGDPNR